ncbi:MAG: hypothetical protein M3R70_04520 [Actinomycetota bacterium]|nr:hypothetical protein [Actinomycetota bacterium]
MGRTVGALIAAAAALAVGGSQAGASPWLKYGLQDDAWISHGSPAAPLSEDRLAILDRLGVDVVRYTLRWDLIAPLPPLVPEDPDDPGYRWIGPDDTALQALHRHGISVLLTFWGTPWWANGGRGPTYAPRSRSALAAFATATATRYPWIRNWEIWNEPNQVGGLRPNSPRIYVDRLLNPAADALHAINPDNLVAGGATSPRATDTAVSAVAFMRGMRAAGARFDAYSHHPHPRAFGRGRLESPMQTLPCSLWLTMANLRCLLSEVRRNFGPKQIWLTEYAYKTNPPDTWRGVPPHLQARYIGEAELRAYRAAGVNLLIQFLMRDEPVVGRWASGLLTARDRLKPSFYAYMLPLAQVSRHGVRTVLWGQVRPRFGPQRYRLQRKIRGHWTNVGKLARTTRRGYFTRVVYARRRFQFRIWSPVDAAASPPLAIR